MIDNQLNDRALSILMFAPIMMLSFGYWFLGNRQMFFNEHLDIEYANASKLTDHKAFNFSRGYDYSMVLLVFIVILFLLPRIAKLGEDALDKTRFFPRKACFNKGICFDEKIGDYFESLSGL